MNAAVRNLAAHRAPRSAPSDSEGGKFVWMLRTSYLLFFFGLGALVWVCQPKPQIGAPPVIPIGPPQVLLTAVGALIAIVLLREGRGKFPLLFRPTISTLFQFAGIGSICLGALFFLQPGPRLIDTLLYLDRWILPIFVALVLVAATKFRISYHVLIYGMFAGLIVTVISVEIARRTGMKLPVGNFTEGRFSGFLNHPNQLGIVLSTTAPFLLVPLLSRRWILKVAGMGMIGVYLIGLYQCLSKTNLALFPVGLAFSFLLVSVGTTRSFLRAVGTVALLALLMMGVALAAFRVLQDYSPRDAQLIENSLVDPRNAATVEDREGVWAEATQFIHRRPWGGYGPGWAEDNISVTHAHNLYLQAWLDAGLLGLIGSILISLAAIFRLAGIFLEILRSGKPLPDDLLPALASVAMVNALLGNSMSASLQTATYVPYAIAVALSLLDPALSRPALKSPPREVEAGPRWRRRLTTASSAT